MSTANAASLRWNVLDSVGTGSTNRSADVRQVQELLNMIGMSFGGTFEFKLVENGIWSDDLGKAIGEFQRVSMNPLMVPQNERNCVLPGSETLKRLNELTGRFGLGDAPSLHPTRRRIIEIARQEKGIVSDRSPGGRSDLDEYNQRHGTSHPFDPSKSYRRGMARLRDYFTDTVSPSVNWNFRGKYTNQRFNTNPGDDVDYDMTQEEGIMLWNRRPPLGSAKTAYAGDAQGRGFYNGFHWCGVFAVWALQQVGMKNVKWSQKLRGITATKAIDYSVGTHPAGSLMYSDIDMKARQKVLSGKLPIRPGDVVVIMGGNNHHLILTELKLQSYVDYRGTFTAIAGNSLYQEVAEETHDLTKIYRVYHTWPG
jgi:hypothetical protein